MRNAPVQRLNVPIAVLLERAQAAKAKAIADHEKAVAEYPEKVDAYSVAVIRALSTALDAAYQGNLPDTSYGGKLQISPRRRLPDKPTKPVLNTSKIDRDIRLLESTSQETTVVSTDSNWSCYL